MGVSLNQKADAEVRVRYRENGTECEIVWEAPLDLEIEEYPNYNILSTSYSSMAALPGSSMTFVIKGKGVSPKITKKPVSYSYTGTITGSFIPGVPNMGNPDPSHNWREAPIRDFWIAVGRYHSYHPDMWIGAAVVAVLELVRPELANQIRSAIMEDWHMPSEDRLTENLHWVDMNW